MAETARLISFSTAADVIRDALTHGHVAAADRVLTDAVSRLLHAAPDTTVDDAVTAPAGTVGDIHYDALLSTAFAYALLQLGSKPPSWMLDTRPLEEEWLWDGDADASVEWRNFIRERTPALFRSKNILLRARDLEAP